MNVRQSATLDKLAPALLKAQQQCAAPLKDSTNPHFKSKYADLEAVRAAMFNAFADNGLLVVQMPGFTSGMATVVNRLLHTSGEWLEWESGSPLAKLDPQSWRGAVTYIRRTCLEGIGNLAAEDDDGNTASKPPKSPKAKEPEPVTGKRQALNAKQKGWFYTKAQGDQVLVHKHVTLVTGQPCTFDEWPMMTVEQHAKISDAIDVELDARREDKAGGAA